MEEQKGLNHQPGGENTRGILFFLLFFFIFLVCSFVFVDVLFKSYTDRVFMTKIESADRNVDLSTLKKYEDEQLSSYGYVNEKKGIVRIPIELAVEKVLRQYQ